MFAFRRRLTYIAIWTCAIALTSCGEGGKDVLGVHGMDETFTARELREAKAFMAHLQPPAGFKLEPKSCPRGPTTRCFTSSHVAYPLTAARLLALLHQMGVRPLP